MGSAASAWPDAIVNRPSAVPPSSPRNDQKIGDMDVFFILFLSILILEPLFSFRSILAGHACSASQTAPQSVRRQRN
jgi:hypothetical protein